MQKNISIEITSGYVNLNNIVITHPDFAAMSNDEIKQLVMDCELSVNYMTGDLTYGEDLVGKGSIALGDLEFAMHDDGVFVDDSEEPAESFLEQLKHADLVMINGVKATSFNIEFDDGSEELPLVVSDGSSTWVIARDKVNKAVKVDGGWDLGMVSNNRCLIKLFKLTEM